MHGQIRRKPGNYFSDGGKGDGLIVLQITLIKNYIYKNPASYVFLPFLNEGSDSEIANEKLINAQCLLCTYLVTGKNWLAVTIFIAVLEPKLLTQNKTHNLQSFNTTSM